MFADARVRMQSGNYSTNCAIAFTSTMSMLLMEPNNEWRSRFTSKVAITAKSACSFVFFKNAENCSRTSAALLAQRAAASAGDLSRPIPRARSARGVQGSRQWIPRTLRVAQRQ